MLIYESTHICIDPEDTSWKRYPVIWPNNIDESKSLAEGRLISREDACLIVVKREREKR